MKRKRILQVLTILSLISSFFLSCDRRIDNILKGEVVAILDPCMGNEIIVSVSNNPEIGSNADIYGNRYFKISNDTIFEYDNVVAIPLYVDSDGRYRYYWRNKAIKTIKKGDYLEFEYRLLNASDTTLYVHNQSCLAVYGPPSNINRLGVKRITKFNY